jgi:hypothetical protein
MVVFRILHLNQLDFFRQHPLLLLQSDLLVVQRIELLLKVLDWVCFRGLSVRLDLTDQPGQFDRDQFNLSFEGLVGFFQLGVLVTEPLIPIRKVLIKHRWLFLAALDCSFLV